MADNQGSLSTLMVYMGGCLLAVQSAEGAINECLTKYIPTDDLSLKTLEEYEDGLRKLTLGRFIMALRRRFAFDDKCERTLDSFLRDRNRFIHNFIRTDGSGFDLNTKEGMVAAFEFLKSLRAQAVFVQETMLGICDVVEVIAKSKDDDAIGLMDFDQRMKEAWGRIKEFKVP